KHHLGLYPLPADRSRLPELAGYDTGKGTARFPLDQPIPYALIARLVEQLARERRPPGAGGTRSGGADGGSDSGADGGSD
ncbi:MAG: hypothetical protein JWP61_2886, partial [Friedmanniella sp.]|nr:hypothetical protein [Friedmanniella sp.]